jgi:cell division protein FtsB
MIKRLPPFTRNFYFLTGLFFVVWMLFFDTNDIYTQAKLNGQLNRLEIEKEFYNEKITEVRKDRSELFSDQDLLEKFAREKYLMKKKSEDLYIIKEKSH